MKTTVISALGLLASAVQAKWIVQSYGGQQCTGQRIWHYENPGSVDLYCTEIQYWETAASVQLAVPEDSDKSWEFELHHDDICVDLDFGHFTLEPGMSYCTQTQDAVSLLVRAA